MSAQEDVSGLLEEGAINIALSKEKPGAGSGPCLRGAILYAESSRTLTGFLATFESDRVL